MRKLLRELRRTFPTATIRTTGSNHYANRAAVATAGPVFDLEPSMQFHLINDGGLVRLDELETMERNRSPLDPPLRGSAALWDRNTACRVLVNISRDGIALFDTKTKISHRMKKTVASVGTTLNVMLRNRKESAE